jgi:hypothetical protein
MLMEHVSELSEANPYCTKTRSQNHLSSTTAVHILPMYIVRKLITVPCGHRAGTVMNY